MSPMAHIERPNTGRDQRVEWGTPSFIYDALRPFHDPADGKGGYDREWKNLVFVNPPYGNEVARWVRRCAEHGSAMLLVFARTDTSWFHAWIWPKATGIFFFRKRLHFVPLVGQSHGSNAGAPSCLVAFGEEAFERIRTAHLDGKLVRLRRAV